MAPAIHPGKHTHDDELGMALNSTRMIRFGLEAMWSAVDTLPDRMTIDPRIRPALVTLMDWLEKLEQGQLRDQHLTRNYLIIRPVSLADPSSAESLAAITAAIGILKDHALIITTDD